MTEHEALRWVEAWAAKHRHKAISITREDGVWTIRVEDALARTEEKVRAANLCHGLVDLRAIIEPNWRKAT